MTVAPAGPAEVCEHVLALVGDRAEAQVRVVSGSSGLTRFANSSIHQNVAEDSLVVALKVAVEGRLAAAATNQVDGDNLGRLVESAVEAARLRPVDPHWPGLAPPAPAPRLPEGRYDPGTAGAEPPARAETARAFVEAGGGLAAAGYFETEGRTVAYANSAGQRLEGRFSAAGLDGVLRTASSDGNAVRSAARMADVDAAGAGRVAAAKARRGAQPIDVEPGRFEVVLEPSCVADLLRFFSWYGFNAKCHAEGASFVELGQPQLDETLGLRDDATDPRAIGLAFDVEGTPKRPVDLVTAGVPVALAHDRRTAAMAGTTSTGHAVAGGESFGAVPTNLFLHAATTTSPHQLVASMERGLLVSDLWYTRILDPKTQVVTGLTRNGVFLVEGGVVTHAVRNLRFTQSYVEALGPGAVLGVGDDARLVGDGIHAPTLHLASWNFTGGARG